MKKKQCPHTGSPGFTLLELVLVLTIISVLVGAGIYLVTGNIDVAKETRVEADIKALTAQLKLYENRNYTPPTTDQGLEALVTKPTTEPAPRRWTQLLEEVPIDPWGRPYQYRFPPEKRSKGFDLFSMGPDGQPDTEDDIGNWRPESEDR